MDGSKMPTEVFFFFPTIRAQKTHKHVLGGGVELQAPKNVSFNGRYLIQPNYELRKLRYL